jgi:hypothetical protein
MSFFDQVPKSASITYDQNGTKSEMEEPDDEAVRAAITAFRQIYTKSEPTSAAVALNVLERSIRARKGPQQAQARAAIKELRDSLNEIVDRGIGLGIVFERPSGSDPVPPLKILDTYFHVATSIQEMRNPSWPTSWTNSDHGVATPFSASCGS